ncbi:MAG TPA: hypothetical protein DDW94_00140 [Deltaproteobacteria bacterium]|nr:MAG: hypothetical protein A2Z79_05505 [Deltaproteobacteria bacterium GWA2_55_82]OGQ62434.1 MAG: hypothetical protein A3I81_01550 [Deltaproteobacteria bacterium RIFCSPLOWO2_02_FULL_55_12]OIJ73348.1 MAG: hypothetical protein A2V21_303155 [Deltaproteobacteria bacterium GWC2_55_46]HBG45376.1 hypothetical protein [Deltaproteobacteria bacterium]HCY10207.1 hypothetical protein [Deltaproteobacteria bacterium]
MSKAGSADILYIVTDAIGSLKENKVTTALTSLTLAFSLAIFSLFVFIITNLNGVIEGWGEKTQVIAYVKDAGTVAPDVLRNRILEIPGVSVVEFVSKEKALDEIRAELKGYEGILEGVDSNPLPASFEIKVKDEFNDPARLASVVGVLKAQEWVDEVQYSSEWVEKLASLVRFVKMAAVIIGAFIALATLFIISNTIRLAVYARSAEIEIMKLVGASDMYVKAPFVIEGMLQGLLGGLLAMGALAAGRAVLIGHVPAYLRFALEMPFPAPLFLLALVLSGMAMGVAGSLVSMNRFLKV